MYYSWRSKFAGSGRRTASFCEVSIITRLASENAVSLELLSIQNLGYVKVKLSGLVSARLFPMQIASHSRTSVARVFCIMDSRASYGLNTWRSYYGVLIIIAGTFTVRPN